MSVYDDIVYLVMVEYGKEQFRNVERIFSTLELANAYLEKVSITDNLSPGYFFSHHYIVERTIDGKF
jgi:hypothetical protein